MAFASEAGHGNLPNGNFSSVIYSKKVQLAFRKSSTVEDITNNDYFGEIALIYGCKRTASVRSMKYSTLAKLEK